MSTKYELNPSGVRFDEEQHRYFLGDKELKGITTTLIELAFPNDYEGISTGVLNHAANRGSAVHKALQDDFEGKFTSPDFDDILNDFNGKMKLFGLTSIAFEYIVTDGKNFASPIDIVAVNEKGEICIIDTKTTSKLYEDKVAYQTSIYDKLFRIQNPNLPAPAHHYVYWCSVDDDFKFREDSLLKELPFVGDEIIDNLFFCYLNNLPFDITDTYGDLPVKVQGVEKYLSELNQKVQEYTSKMDEIKSGLLSLMQQYNVKSYTGQYIRLTRVEPKPRESFDTKKFKAEHPDMVKQYIKVSPQKPSIRLTFKN